jgi:hypothetical protein
VKKTKTIYHVYAEVFGEYDFFFDEKGNELCHWHLNDAHWRSEYMNPLLTALGIELVEAEWTDERWIALIREILIDDGASEEDFE